MKDNYECCAHRMLEKVNLGPLRTSIGYALRRAQLAVFDDFIRTLEIVGLRPAYFAALVVIELNPGQKQSVVSGALGIQRTNFVTMVDFLEQRGLLARHPCKHDRRSHELHLTEGGRSVLRQALQLHETHEARFAEKLEPGGREQLLSLLWRFFA